MPPHRLRLASYPTGPRSDPYGSLLSPFGINSQLRQRRETVEPPLGTINSWVGAPPSVEIQKLQNRPPQGRENPPARNPASAKFRANRLTLSHSLDPERTVPHFPIFANSTPHSDGLTHLRQRLL
jgi:hypothetical protein